MTTYTVSGGARQVTKAGGVGFENARDGGVSGPLDPLPGRLYLDGGFGEVSVAGTGLAGGRRRPSFDLRSPRRVPLPAGEKWLPLAKSGSTYVLSSDLSNVYFVGPNPAPLGSGTTQAYTVQIVGHRVRLRNVVFENVNVLVGGSDALARDVVLEDVIIRNAPRSTTVGSWSLVGGQNYSLRAYGALGLTLRRFAIESTGIAAQGHGVLLDGGSSRVYLEDGLLRGNNPSGSFDGLSIQSASGVRWVNLDIHGFSRGQVYASDDEGLCAQLLGEGSIYGGGTHGVWAAAPDSGTRGSRFRGSTTADFAIPQNDNLATYVQFNNAKTTGAALVTAGGATPQDASSVQFLSTLDDD